MNKEVYDYISKEFVEQPEKVKRFLEEIRKVCKEYQLSIWKQGSYQNEFIIEKYNEPYMMALEQAGIKLEKLEEPLSLENKLSEFFVESGINIHGVNPEEENITDFNSFAYIKR